MLESLLALTLARAQFKAPQAKTELVASSKSIMAGVPFSIALHMTMAPGWHSYYINPGESGQATSIVWHLPAGFKAGPILWPVPERIVVAGVAGFVYQKETWLVTIITPPANLAEGQAIKISADVNWLLCREACVPQKSALFADLIVAGASAPNPAFAPAMSGLSTPLKNTGIKATITMQKAVLSISDRIHTTKGITFFPADPTFFGADLPEVHSTNTGINLSVPLSKYAPGLPKRMTGILVLPDGEAKGAHWIDVKVTEH